MATGRVDLPGMLRSCRLLRNFIAHPIGGAIRRPSLLYVGAAAAAGSRLIPFRAGAASYMLELSDIQLRVWNVATLAVAATLVAPWTAAQVPDIQVAQSNDYMWLTHPDMVPQELVNAPGGWTLGDLYFDPGTVGVYPPLRNVNTSEITLAVGALVGVGGATTLTASAALFDADHAGAMWQVSHYRDSASTELQLPVTGVGAALLSMTANPAAGEQFSIGSVVYRWVAGNPTAPYELTIGGTPAASKQTAIDAINGELAPATIGIGTVAHPDVEASDGGSISTATAAAATLTISNNLNDGATCTIDGQVYTFKNTLSAAYHVKIGANKEATLDNLILAMDVTGVAGTNYGVGTAAHTTVNARARVGNVATFYARTAGTAGNSIAVSRNTGSGASLNWLAWSGGTLSGGTAASTEQIVITARELGEDGNGIAVAETMTNGAWNVSATAGGTEVDSTSEAVSIKGRWNFTTVGRWQGTVYIERLNAAGVWEVVRQYTGRLDTNKTDEGIADMMAEYRIRGVDLAGEASSDVANPRFILEAQETIIHGIYEVTSFVSSTVVNVAVLAESFSTDATPIWREGAFSRYRGFPAAVALHEERLLFAGNTAEPQKVWGSAVGDFRNFEETGRADGSWQWQFSSQQAQTINWMVSSRGLVIGTDLGVRTWDSGENGITPLHPPLQRQLIYNGCADIPPEPVGDAVLYVQRGGRTLFEYAYEEASGGYITPDLTQLVEHFMWVGGIKQLAVSRLPFTLIWAAMHDGSLLSCTYSRRDEVVGWSKHTINGTVGSVASVPAPETATDEVWIVAVRPSGTCIERFYPGHLEAVGIGGTQLWHLDHAKSGNAPGGTLTGLSYLNGETVRVVAFVSGIPVLEANQVVSGGQVTAVTPGASSVAVGYLCEPAYLQPQLFDFVTESGSSIGRRFNCKKAHIRFHLSGECKYAAGTDKEYDTVPFESDTDYTGLKTIQVPPDFAHGVNLVLKADSIFSCNVLNVVPEFELYGK